MNKSDYKKKLEDLVEWINGNSEYAEVSCRDGWHIGEHTTDVIRVNDVEEQIYKMIREEMQE